MADDHKPFHNPFAALAKLKASMPAATDVAPGLKPQGSTDSHPRPSTVKPHASIADPESSTVEPHSSVVKPRGCSPGVSPKGPARAVIRLERAGRGGKEVTVVEHLGLRSTELEKWLKQLKAGLGCGGVVEGETLVLQGNHRERLAKLLTAKGVRKVTMGA